MPAHKEAGRRSAVTERLEPPSPLNSTSFKSASPHLETSQLFRLLELLFNIVARRKVAIPAGLVVDQLAYAGRLPNLRRSRLAHPRVHIARTLLELQPPRGKIEGSSSAKAVPVELDAVMSLTCRRERASVAGEVAFADVHTFGALRVELVGLGGAALAIGVDDEVAEANGSRDRSHQQSSRELRRQVARVVDGRGALGHGGGESEMQSSSCHQVMMKWCLRMKRI